MEASQPVIARTPVDNRTYNVMQALVSKLEPIEAYRKYSQDEGGQIFGELIANEIQQAARVMDELKDCITPH